MAAPRIGRGRRVTYSIGAICNGKCFTPASRAVQGMLGAWPGEVTAWKTMASAMLRGGPRVPAPRDGAQHSSATHPFCQLSATPHNGKQKEMCCVGGRGLWGHSLICSASPPWPLRGSWEPPVLLKAHRAESRLRARLPGSNPGSPTCSLSDLGQGA